MKKISSRIEYIDIAKCFALFFVVLGHLFTIASKEFNWIFSFHMPLFFILSGMCINIDKHKDFASYTKSKFKSLIIPYFIFLFMGLVVTMIIPSWRQSFSLKPTLDLALWFTQPETLHVGQIWFLVCLFVTSILYYGIEKFTSDSKYVNFFTYLLISIVGFNIGKYMSNPGIFSSTYGRLPFKIDCALTAVIFMKIGNLIKERKIVEYFGNLKIHKYIITVISLIVINYYLGTYTNGYVNLCDCTFNNYINYYVAAVTGCLMVVLVAYKIKKCKALEYFGKNSLPMFAVHTFFLVLAAYILGKIYGYPVMYMQNIKYSHCYYAAFGIMLALVPCAVVYNFLKSKLLKAIESFKSKINKVKVGN